jgi:uncharacterized CHY-type Zn-finger protein
MKEKIDSFYLCRECKVNLNEFTVFQIPTTRFEIRPLVKNADVKNLGWKKGQPTYEKPLAVTHKKTSDNYTSYKVCGDCLKKKFPKLRKHLDIH